MQIIRRLTPAVVAVVVMWVATGATSAQITVANIVFVRDADQSLFLVLNGERHRVPIYPLTPDEVAAIPESGRWVVPSDDGAIALGDNPHWERHPEVTEPAGRVHVVQAGETLNYIANQYGVSGDAILQANGITDPNRVFRVGERITIPNQRFTPVPGISADDPGQPRFLEGVAGQTAEAASSLSGQRFRATVVSMVTTRMLRSTRQATTTGYFHFDDRWASGRFIVVVADIENIGTRPSCCLPSFRLHDARGRQFSGETSSGNEKVRHAGFWYLGSSPAMWDNSDYQPNLRRRGVFVYDVPTDATGFMLTSDR